MCRIQTPSRRSLKLETRQIPASLSQAARMVFLHEGLGSLAQWRDWPDTLCRHLSLQGLVYSRYGYGRSTPRPAGELWSPDYLLEQARDHLPALLKALHLDHDPIWIYGHSDGGTIALLYAALYPDRVLGIVVAAPHVFAEPETLAAIAAVRNQYATSGLRDRLQRYHADPDSAFGGWSGAWLNPPFAHWDIRSVLQGITCPVLAIQGENDEYASLKQIEDIAAAAPQTECWVIPHCGHSPHREQPDVLLHGIGNWFERQQSPRNDSMNRHSANHL